MKASKSFRDQSINSHSKPVEKPPNDADTVIYIYIDIMYKYRFGHSVS